MTSSPNLARDAADSQVTPDDLKARLRGLGWTQGRLARAIGRDPGLISRVIRNPAYSPGLHRRLVREIRLAEQRRRRRLAKQAARLAAPAEPTTA